MVDLESRKTLASLLRHLAAGQLSNDDFELRLPASMDPAVAAVQRAAWFLYDDLHEHKLTGKYRVTRLGRKEVARWILFLTTSTPYRWPDRPVIEALLILPNALSLGLLGKAYFKWFASHGDFSVWPFMDQAELDVANATAPYLNGSPSSSRSDGAKGRVS